MTTWAPKDPDATLDYVYTIPLDAGDSFADYNFTKLTGDVVIDSESRTGADITAWLSGGTDGELTVFYVEWETSAGRIDDDLVLLDVFDDAGELVISGYAKPAPDHLTMRYPAFAAVPQATIRYWLVDAERYVTDAWSEGDYAAGLMALAAHNMALAGYGTDAAATAGIPAGVSSFKSGTFSMNFTEAAANARAGGDYASTRYGQEYLALLRRNRSGPLVAPTGALPAPIGHYVDGEA